MFEGGGAPTLLGATLSSDQVPCFVWSAPVDADPADLVIERDGDPVEAVPFLETDGADWRDPYVLDGADDGLQVVCADTTDPLTAGAPVRVNWAGGTWTAILEPLRPGEIVSDLRRADVPVAEPQ